MGKLPPPFCHVLFPKLQYAIVSFHIYSIPVSQDQITSLYQVIEIFFLSPFFSILSFCPSFFPSFLPMALQTISWSWTPSISSSNHSYVFLLCAPFFNWGLKSIVFYRVGMFTLQSTSNLEDQDFILDLFSSENSESAFSCWGLFGVADPAATYTTKCTAPRFLQACNHPHPASWDIRFLILCSFVQLITEHIRTKWSYSMSVL